MNNTKKKSDELENTITCEDSLECTGSLWWERFWKLYHDASEDVGMCPVVKIPNERFDLTFDKLRLQGSRNVQGLLQQKLNCNGSVLP